MPKSTMQFGLTAAIPDTAKAAWGARLIFPDDLLHDRQDIFGDEQAKSDLLEWLNGGALRTARKTALRLSNSYEMTPRDSKTVTLYEDAQGIIVGNPNGSHGYLYVAGWIHPQTDTFLTSDGFKLLLHGDRWTDGDLAFNNDGGWPVDANSKRLEGTLNVGMP